jgi:hypothetical protein
MGQHMLIDLLRICARFSRKITKSRKMRNDAGAMLPTCRLKWIGEAGLRDAEFGSTRGRLRIWMRLILRVTQSFVHDRGPCGRREVTKVFRGGGWASGERMGAATARRHAGSRMSRESCGDCGEYINISIV